MTLDLGTPNVKQDLALRDRHRHVGYGGARGGGKSWFVRAKAVILAMAHRGIKILIVRLTFRELLNNHIEPLQKMLNGIAKYNKSDKCFRFANGSSIWMGYCSCDSDLEQYQGAEYDVVFLDEATNLREEWIKKINLTVRGANNFPKRTYYTCNPGGVSHSYFKRLFVERRFEGDEVPEDYSFIQALVTDNVALMASQPEYIAELKSLPPKLREAWLNGSWDIFEGQFFEDFIPNPPASKAIELGVDIETLRERRQWCHVIKPFDINAGICRSWNLFRSYDFGYHRPFSMGYWAVDHDGIVYRIAEYYGGTDTPNEGVKWDPEQQFRTIREWEQQQPWLKGRTFTESIADPACWDVSRGYSVADIAGKYGIFFTPGDHNRVPGWLQLHYRFQFTPEGFPRMYIFDTCKAFIRTIPQMMYSKTKPEDLDTTLEDHCADEVRYFLMSRPVKPYIEVQQKVYQSDPLNMLTDRRY